MLSDLPSTVADAVFTTGVGVGVGAGVLAVPVEPPRDASESATAANDRASERLDMDNSSLGTVGRPRNVGGPNKRTYGRVLHVERPAQPARTSGSNWRRYRRA